MAKRLHKGSTSATEQQTALAAQQAASLAPADVRTLERLQLAALPLGQLVDRLLDTVRDGSDQETGEVRQGVDDVIEQLNLSLEAKTQAYAHVAQRLASEADSFDELAKHYAAKAETRRSERKRLMKRLQGELERLGLHALKTPTITAYLQSSPPAVELTVLTDDEVPDEYCERRPSLSMIAAALRNGVKLGFARFQSSKHLRFR